MITITLVGQKTLADCPDIGPPAFQLSKVSRWIAQYGQNCLFCNIMMARSGKKHNSASIDHINARCFGGGNEWTNLQVICRKCNHIKSEAESILAQKIKADIKASLGF